MVNIKTIIFDFGNVVGFFDHRRALKRLASHTRLSVEEMYALIYDGPLEDDFESGRMTGVDFLRCIGDKCGLQCEVELLRTTFADIFWPNQEVCSLIPRLKPAYRILLGSNTNEVHAARFREQFADCLRHFDHLVMSFEIGVRKPQAKFFEACQKLADCKPAECVFIDDLPANIAGAKAFGMNAIQYAAGNGLARELQTLGVQI